MTNSVTNSVSFYKIAMQIADIEYKSVGFDLKLSEYTYMETSSALKKKRPGLRLDSVGSEQLSSPSIFSSTPPDSAASMQSNKDVFSFDLDESPPQKKPTKAQIRRAKKMKPYCEFCFNNARCKTEKETGRIISATMKGPWKEHQLRDINGHVICPHLFKHTCEGCGATGRWAHTIRYCPVKKSSVIQLPPTPNTF